MTTSTEAPGPPYGWGQRGLCCRGAPGRWWQVVKGIEPQPANGLAIIEMMRLLWHSKGWWYTLVHGVLFSPILGPIQEVRRLKLRRRRLVSLWLRRLLVSRQPLLQLVGARHALRNLHLSHLGLRRLQLSQGCLRCHLQEHLLALPDRRTIAMPSHLSKL